VRSDLAEEAPDLSWLLPEQVRSRHEPCLPPGKVRSCHEYSTLPARCCGVCCQQDRKTVLYSLIPYPEAGGQYGEAPEPPIAPGSSS
jgi:hypothetical protein